MLGSQAWEFPRLEGKCRKHIRKPWGIATPVCALVRNDTLLEKEKDYVC